MTGLEQTKETKETGQTQCQQDDLDEATPSMPELPAVLTLTTDQQFKAIADPVRTRILGVIQTRPATAKQIAKRLNIAPGTIGHHLQVLEAAGLAHVTATRIVHGIVAKYYTRTARIFSFQFSPEITGGNVMFVDIARHAYQEIAESAATAGKEAIMQIGFPHVRLSPERARIYQERLEAILDDLLRESPDPSGCVYGLCTALFLAPPYLQDPETNREPDDATPEHE